MKHKIFIITAFLLLTISANAQLSLKIKAATGLSRYISTPAIYPNQSNLSFNYSFGTEFSYIFLKRLSLNIGEQFNKSGYYPPYLININYYYFEFPITLNIFLTKKLSVYGGISSKIFLFTSYNSEIAGKYIGKDETAANYPFNITYGLSYSLFKKIDISINYFKSLTPINYNAISDYCKNYGLMLSVAYKIF